MGALFSASTKSSRKSSLISDPPPPHNGRRRGSADRRFSAVAAGKLILQPDPATLAVTQEVMQWVQRGAAAVNAGSLEFPFSTEKLSHTTTLNFSRCGWTDSHVKLLAIAILPIMPALEELSLGYNDDVGDEALCALADCSRGSESCPGALQNLKRLYLAGNRIGATGCEALAAAMQAGALPALTYLNLAKNADAEESVWKCEREMMRREQEQMSA